MKKLLLSISLIGIFGGAISIASANNTSCKDVEFSNGVTACVNIENAGTDRWSLSTSLDNGTTSNLRCDIMTPDSSLRSISSCNGTFSYNGEKSGRIKLWIRYNEGEPSDREGKPSNNSERTYPQWVYDFGDEERTSDDINDYYDYDNDYNTSTFSITASPSNPSVDEYSDITVTARDGSYKDSSYRGTVRFTVQKRSSSSSSWTTASTSYYTLAKPTYTFTSSDYGDHEFSNLVRFRNDSYDYRLVVTDDNDSSIVGYKIFYLDGNNSNNNGNYNYNTDNFYVNASESTPHTNSWLDITVRARNGSSTDTSYRGTVYFKIERKSGSSRVSASTSYYELSKNSFGFGSSYNGEYIIDSLLRFKQSGDYRLTVYDDSDDSIEGTKTFSVNGSTYDNDNDYNTSTFSITASPSNPSVDEYSDITVTARDGSYKDSSYRGTVRFTVQKRSSSSSSWTTASTSYYTLAKPTYTFTSSDYGDHEFSNLVRFRNDSYDYRLVVTDDNDSSIVGYKIFYLDGNNSNNNGDLNNFYVTADDTTPNASQYIDLTIKARDSDGTTLTEYTDAINFRVYYRSSSSYSWNETTSSSYYTMSSSYRNGYDFSTSDYGEADLTNFIKFNKNNYQYKVRVYDENNTSIYKEITFTVGSSNSSSNVNGFSSAELDTVQAIYDSRDKTISKLEISSSKLRNNTRRQNMSDDFKTAMREILDDDNDKTYDNYDDFIDAWTDWYRYTTNNK